MKIKLKEVMEEKQVSVYSLSKKTGISPNNLAKLIKCETSSIRFENVDLICHHLEVSISDIFEAETPLDSKNTQT